MPVRASPPWWATGASSDTWPISRGASSRTTRWSGSGSVVLHHAVIGTGATVGANAVVPNDMEVPAGALALGVPATIRPDRSDRLMIQLSAAQYVTNGHRFRELQVRLD